MEYNMGVYFPKYYIKALSWFFQAASNGHLYGKYQMCKIFAKGTDCRRLLPNKRVALLNF
jgi:TPR repeat protein